MLCCGTLKNFNEKHLLNACYKEGEGRKGDNREV